MRFTRKLELRVSAAASSSASGAAPPGARSSKTKRSRTGAGEPAPSTRSTSESAAPCASSCVAPRTADATYSMSSSWRETYTCTSKSRRRSNVSGG